MRNIKVSEIADIDLAYYTDGKHDRELRHIVSNVAHQLNKRIARVKAADYPDSFKPALHIPQAAGGRDTFYAQGLTHNGLLRMAAAERQFYKAKTSTVKGVKHYYTSAYETANRINPNFSSYTEDQKRRWTTSVWDLFKHVKASHPSWDSDQVREICYNVVNDGNAGMEDAVKNVEKMYRGWQYEQDEKQREEDEREHFYSNPFDIH